ncbi:MAG: hypothetical protein U0359_08440 [Byssovorax sp.]
MSTAPFKDPPAIAAPGAPPAAAPATPAAPPPIALDGLAWGVDLLDAILVVSLADAHLHALWAHPDASLRPEDLANSLRDAYRVGQFAARRLGPAAPAGADRRSDLGSPILTLELAQRTAVLRRIRDHLVACVFDAAMPLGMARLVASRLAAALDPELPRASEAGAVAFEAPVIHRPAPPPTHPDEPPATLTFGAVRPRRTLPPARATSGELDRARKLIAYLETHAPEPHTARLRLALRAGLTLVALDHPEALGPEAMVLIESAVEEILGLDRAELRRIA